MNITTLRRCGKALTSSVCRVIYILMRLGRDAYATLAGPLWTRPRRFFLFCHKFQPPLAFSALLFIALPCRGLRARGGGPAAPPSSHRRLSRRISPDAQAGGGQPEGVPANLRGGEIRHRIPPHRRSGVALRLARLGAVAGEPHGTRFARSLG